MFGTLSETQHIDGSRVGSMPAIRALFKGDSTPVREVSAGRAKASAQQYMGWRGRSGFKPGRQCLQVLNKLFSRGISRNLDRTDKNHIWLREHLRGFALEVLTAPAAILAELGSLNFGTGPD
jgi:hypothetical protein